MTSGADVVLPSDADQIVTATAQTLTSTGLNPANGGTLPGDQLDGGAGHDVLALSGSGSFDLARLSQFTGFEEVRLTNTTSGSAYLALRNGVDLTVTLSDGAPASSAPYGSTAGAITVVLGTGKVTLLGGNEADYISAYTPARLQAGTSLDGGGGSDSLSLSYDTSTTNPTFDPVTGAMIPPVYRDTVYDLTGVSLHNIETLSVSGYSGIATGTTTIVKVDTAALVDVTTLSFISLSGESGKLVTGAASLDMTGKTVGFGSSGGSIESTNATGTTFTTSNYQMAALVKGGAGQDTLVVNGVTLTEAQRAQIFQSSIEILKDATGTYSKVGSEVVQIIDQQNNQTLFDNSSSTQNYTYKLGSGDYTIKLSSGDNSVTGAAGNQTIYSPAGTGQNHIDGGDVYDTMVYNVASTAINIQVLSGGEIKVGSHSDYLTNVEALQFTDKTILTSSLLSPVESGGNSGNPGPGGGDTGGTPEAPITPPTPMMPTIDPSRFGTITHDVHSAAGEVYALYDALLGRVPDAQGQQYFTRALESGASLEDVAQSMLQSPE
ncbi:hypothetical protein GCM10008965_34610 [Methylorubrum aminovorans]|uniref:DUF4214 domain-containing protein n=1 Tax=Methylorubrum aminovorans TaxID=269069 RepID=UPI0023E9BC81|nr:DUF4214 domain-containing protein [Methylorubrum aminovorans]GMA79953.1 hypothetical protein GCM10025880_63700 [Methylorubrum aminovorans]